VLGILASRPPDAPREFSPQELASLSGGDMSNAQASQMLQALCDRGLIYRTRHGRFAFTVPMSETMIQRRLRSEQEVADSWQTTGATKPSPAKSKGWRWFR
jgi:DNA-binding IclR family transcriptional regulator